MADPLRHDANTQNPFDPTNPFLDRPSSPPPAYNFHIRDPEAGLPPRFQSQHNYPSNEPITPLKTVATNIILSPYITNYPSHNRSRQTTDYYNQKKHNRKKILCCCVATLVVIVIAMLVVGTAVNWGKGKKFCVKWSDGTTSGDCSSD